MKPKEKFQGKDRTILRKKHILHQRIRQKVKNSMRENTYKSIFVTKSLSDRNRNLSYTGSIGNHVGKRKIDLRQQVKTEMF
jgi:hypothetical protein